jgi:hypothetical protein
MIATNHTWIISVRMLMTSLAKVHQGMGQGKKVVVTPIWCLVALICDSISELASLNLALAPDEGLGGLVIGLAKILDGLGEFLLAVEAGSLQCLAGEDAKPYLHHVEPRGASGGEVEGDVGLGFEPVAVFLVGAVVVQDDVYLLGGGCLLHDTVHEGLEVRTLLGGGGCALDLAGGDVERSEKVERAVAPIGALQAAHELAAGGLYIAGLARERLNRRLLLHAEHDGALERIEIEADDLHRLGGKLRVGADAPAAPALQLNACLTQIPPGGAGRASHRLRQRPAIPRGLSLRWRRLQRLQQPVPMRLAIPGRRTTTRRILQPGQAMLDKPAAPLVHGVGARATLLRHRGLMVMRKARQNDPLSNELEQRSLPRIELIRFPQGFNETTAGAGGLSLPSRSLPQRRRRLQRPELFQKRLRGRRSAPDMRPSPMKQATDAPGSS